MVKTGVDGRLADLPAIEGATGKFLLHQMASVADAIGFPREDD